MKRILLIISVCLSGWFFQACNENVLDISNPNQLNFEDFWKTEADVQKGVNACYSIFYRTGSWQRYLHWRLDLLSDEGYSMSPMVEQGDWTKFVYANYNQGENNGWIWREAYRGIFRANQVIANVPNVSISSEANKKAYLGQAYFLRGYQYFHLAIFWEEVPIVTEPSSPGDQATQNTLTEVWKQIEDDLLKAAELLPEEWTGADKGRVTKGAAKAQLARAYMQQHRWQDAKNQLQWLVEGEGARYYGLVDNYYDNFNLDTENNKESVFEIQFTGELTGAESDNKGATNGHQRSIIFGLAGVGFRDGLARPWILDLYKQENTVDNKFDPRLKVALLYKDIKADFPEEEGYFFSQINSGGKMVDRTWEVGGWGNDVYYRKYSRDRDHTMSAENRNSQLNFRVIRYADILLMYAECINELEGSPANAVPYVDRVRARAGMASLATKYPNSITSKNAFFERLQIERILEMNGECTRWYDIKRWELYDTPEGLQALISRDEDYKNFEVGVSHRQPIPASEVLNNPNLKQLSGY